MSTIDAADGRRIKVSDSIIAGTSITAGTTLAIGTSLTVGGLSILTGSGAPTAIAAKGSLYLNTAGSGTGNRLYVNSSGTGAWKAVVTLP